MSEVNVLLTGTGESVSARKLSIGEVVEASDFYLSTSGTWQPAPTDGHEVIDNGVEWARPTPEPITDRRGAIRAQKERKGEKISEDSLFECPKCKDTYTSHLMIPRCPNCYDVVEPLEQTVSDETIYWGPVVREIMADKVFHAKFPQGLSGGDIYDELVARGTNVASSASVLDVIDYMNELYGPGNA